MRNFKDTSETRSDHLSELFNLHDGTFKNHDH